MPSDKKAVSTLILIILLLCSAVFGALLSYLWVMANYYMEPENTVDLAITGVDFPVNHSDYFYVTIMNPTHSVSETNITEVYFTVAGDNTTHKVDSTDPELPIPIERGTTKTIKCSANWGSFAGETITVYVSGANASGTSYSVKTDFVKLNAEAYFNATESCKYFNVTITNDPNSKINLTIEKIYFNYLWEIPKDNMSIPELPMQLANGTSINVRCFYDWENYKNPAVRVKTQEGYFVDATSNASATVLLAVADVEFSETNSTTLRVTLLNSQESATLVGVTNITLTDDGGVEYCIKEFDPPYIININESATFDCIWNWTEYRSRNATITAYTQQGFKSTQKTVKTPNPVVLKIASLDFNLTNTGSFSATIQNMPCSIQDANITNFTILYSNGFTEINGTAVTPNLPHILAIGENQTFSCALNWTSYEGSNVNVAVYTSDGFNATYSYTLPKIWLNVEFDKNKSVEYFTITVQNNAYVTVNINEIHVNNTLINASLTYPALPISIDDGESVLIVCPFQWQSLSGSEVTIMVKTENGFDIITTIVVP
jgi:hypothetical protein